jgi:hypothetical protein
MLAIGFWIGFFGIWIQIGGFGSELGVFQFKIQIRDASLLHWIFPKRPMGNAFIKSNLKNGLDRRKIAPVGMLFGEGELNGAGRNWRTLAVS